MPAASSTHTLRVLLAVSVTPVKLKAVLPTAALATAQVEPLSSDTLTSSPASRLALNVPLMLCAAVLVTKSVALVPVSVEKLTVDIVVVGAMVSVLVGELVVLKYIFELLVDVMPA